MELIKYCLLELEFVKEKEGKSSDVKEDAADEVEK